MSEPPEKATTGRSFRPYAATFGLLVLATAIGAATRGHLAAPDLVMLYLLVIVIAATRYGRGPALLASTIAVLAYNFFFVPPFHTLAVADERHLITFATMFVVALLISALTLRVRHHEQIARAAEVKAQTEEMRSSLLSAVSHDLRTPLGAITGAATTLRERGGNIDADQRAELIATICDEAERMERFVGNLLEMTRLESGALKVKREWVPLEELLGSASTRLEASRDPRRLRITVANDLPLISVDPVLIEQVLFNLLDNALKHAGQSALIEVSARALDGLLVIEVADRGPGLPAGAEAAIFEKFVRGPQAGARGSGLGLAICRGIVQAHGGTITAANRPEGGSRFKVELPLTKDAPTVPPELEGLIRESVSA